MLVSDVFLKHNHLLANRAGLLLVVTLPAFGQRTTDRLRASLDNT